MCSGCKKIQIENKWINVEDYVHNKSEISVSHGLCKDCINDFH